MCIDSTSPQLMQFSIPLCFFCGFFFPTLIIQYATVDGYNPCFVPYSALMLATFSAFFVSPQCTNIDDDNFFSWAHCERKVCDLFARESKHSEHSVHYLSSTILALSKIDRFYQVPPSSLSSDLHL